MRKIFVVFLLLIIAFACSSKKEGNMIVQGKIKGLKKGKLYLQKMKDSTLVSVDSVALLGNDTFLLTDNVESPVLYYLTFDGNTTDKRILFFGEKGNITINDAVENFGLQPEISGSKNQKILDNFIKMDSRFKNQRLELIKKDFEAQKSKNKDSIAKVNASFDSMIKKRYLFAINFAVNNADSEAAPYIALTELYDANVKYLDTINNALTDKIKNSIYGKKLQEYIEKVKRTEKK